MKTQNICFLTLFFLVVSCTSVPKETTTGPSYAPKGTAPEAPPMASEESSEVDTVALQRYLGLERNAEKLGFAEKTFNTCQVGHGFSKSHNCENKHFVVIHFQLLCRDSEGTIQRVLTSEDLKPISDRPVIWNMKPGTGSVQTNGEGFGQIRTIASSSQKRNRLKLSVGNDFLYVRANEITQVVTPKPWCNP